MKNLRIGWNGNSATANYVRGKKNPETAGYIHLTKIEKQYYLVITDGNNRVLKTATMPSENSRALVLLTGERLLEQMLGAA